MNYIKKDLHNSCIRANMTPMKGMKLVMKKEILFNENEYVLYRVLECLYNCMYGSLSKNVNTKVETLLKELIEIFDQENPKNYDILTEDYYRHVFLYQLTIL